MTTWKQIWEYEVSTDGRMKHKRTRFKLQPEVILQIHEMRKKGATKAKISRVLHIANSTVCDRLSVKKRKHIRKNFK